MRRALATITLALTTVLSTVFAFAPPAGAGGPTSVVITDPSAARATALYYSDAAYEQLAALVGDAAALPGEPSGLGNRALNMTWLIHDVQPWQTQQLFPDAQGGPVVATYGSEETGNEGTTTWSRPVDGRALLRLANQLFDPRGDVPESADAFTPAASSPEPTVSERVVTQTQWFSLSGWRWLVPGLVLGAGLALFGMRNRTQDREPRQELIDLTP